MTGYRDIASCSRIEPAPKKPYPFQIVCPVNPWLASARLLNSDDDYSPPLQVMRRADARNGAVIAASVKRAFANTDSVNIECLFLPTQISRPVPADLTSEFRKSGGTGTSALVSPQPNGPAPQSGRYRNM
jgi:hypothetical protein